ncbi:MAG: glycoside hydrolase family 38 C-terminal domain-containing protein [Dehalococcoidia bacterium]
MKKQTIHLVCNAHLDPVWLWEWEEGAAEALSTFRTAAELCEEFDGFIFNHNEVVLYKWIEEYEPELFSRIQKLVEAGKWNIMGGWYLQPDCNMPSGEGLVRQILAGRRYFEEKFGTRPTTAVNFDSFGHSRGLVQILKKSGDDSYLHCRPAAIDYPQQEHDYIWVGYDGSEVLCTHQRTWYGTFSYGEAGDKLKIHMMVPPELGSALMLWGVGNHGGGPSRKDIRDINRIAKKEKAWRIIHSMPEAYFADIKRHKKELVRWERDLNPEMVGCYTSMVRIKQGYRALENDLFMTEKMVSSSCAQGLMPYPHAELKDAEEDMLWVAFHDILPGSSVEPVERFALQKIGHGREVLSRIRARAFFALASGQPKAKPGTFPVFVFNPHPWETETTITAEFNFPYYIFCPDTYWVPNLTHKGKQIPIQAERPHSNITMDWRKRVAFRAPLVPGMNRFDIRLKRLPKRPQIKNEEKDGLVRIRGQNVDWAMNTQTGLIEHLRVGGRKIVRTGAFEALVMEDTPDPWGMTTDRFDTLAGRFELLSPEKSAEISGVSSIRGSLKPVRIIEDGLVRTIVEAIYGYNDSFLLMNWKLPKTGSEIELELRVFWNEKDRMLKLSVPTTLRSARYFGEAAYGRQELGDSGREAVSQRWTAVVSESDDLALTVVNEGTYGSSFTAGEMRLSLLRSPAYAAHPLGDWQYIPANMFRPRIDQGERVFRFRFKAGPVQERMHSIAREAQVHNEEPMVQWFNPSGKGIRTRALVTLSNKSVQVTTTKQSEDGKGWIIRLFEPTGSKQKTQLRISAGKPIRKTITLKAFEIKTFKLDTETGTIIEADLLEEP